MWHVYLQSEKGWKRIDSFISDFIAKVLKNRWEQLGFKTLVIKDNSPKDFYPSN